MWYWSRTLILFTGSGKKTFKQMPHESSPKGMLLHVMVLGAEWKPHVCAAFFARGALAHPLTITPAAARLASSTAASESASTISSEGTRRYAILGGGFAGVSVAWHLLQFSSKTLQISVELYDEVGIGGAASGVSGGLLHPYTPKGKLAWRGLEGWTSALELLAVAKRASESSIQMDSELESELPPLAWRRGILRPPASRKHCNDFRKFASGEHQRVAGLSCIDGAMANKLLPGLALSLDDLALHISDGLNIDSTRYLKALWRACELHKCSHQTSDSYAILKKQHVDSLSCIADDYDAVVICLGANVTKLPELSDKLPITHCRGVVLHLDLPCDRKGQDSFHGPSVVGDTWLAAQGPCKLILGATKEWDNSNTSATVTDAEARIAADEMVTKAAAFYPPIRHWHFREARAGVRAMTPRTPYGKIPLVGCIDDMVRGSYPRKVISPRFWIFGGLGSRGLIYHGWLGKKLAEAVVTRTEACLPWELLQWKT